MGISTTSQPRAKRKLDRAQPQEKGRHRSCAAPNGASAECQSKTTGSRPWLKLYRRSAAKMAKLQSRDLARDYILDCNIGESSMLFFAVQLRHLFGAIA